MILDDRTYGIQAFDTPEEAFGLMAFHWSDRSEEGMVILNDRQFVRTIGERIIRIVVETMPSSLLSLQWEAISPKASSGVSKACMPYVLSSKIILLLFYNFFQSLNSGQYLFRSLPKAFIVSAILL